MATSAWFAEPLDITVDISFISLKHALPVVAELLRDDGEAVVLIKPQFEVGKTHIRKGIVRDSTLHEQVIHNIKALATQAGLTPVDVVVSPIEGVVETKNFFSILKNRHKERRHVQADETWRVDVAAFGSYAC